MACQSTGAEAVRQGGDVRSWLAGELAAIIGEPAAIEREYRVDVPVTAVFNYPTVDDLATYLKGARGKAAHVG